MAPALLFTNTNTTDAGITIVTLLKLPMPVISFKSLHTQKKHTRCRQCFLCACCVTYDVCKMYDTNTNIDQLYYSKYMATKSILFYKQNLPPTAPTLGPGLCPSTLDFSTISFIYPAWRTGGEVIENNTFS